MERPRWPYPTKLIVSLVLLAFFIYLLTRFHEIIGPIVIAIIIAYILNPIVNFLQNRSRLPRVVVILSTYIVLVAIIIGVPVAVISIMGENHEGFQLNPQKVIATIEGAFVKQYHIAGFTIYPSSIASQVLSVLQGLAQPVVGQTVNLVKTIIASVIWIIFVILVSFYLIKDGAKLEDWVTSHLPPSFLPDYKWIMEEINQIWNAFFRGQLLLSVTVAIIFIALGFIVGLPFALGMGILAGILEFLPTIGHGIWLVSAALLALFLGSTWIPVPHWAFALIIIGLHLIFEQVDINYLIPRIIGRRVQLPTLVVILGIVCGAIFAGILGIPLAAPTIATARIIGRYIFVHLFDMEWIPVSATQPLPPKTYWWRRTRKRETLE